MESINKLKNDIINATGDLEVFGEPTDVLQQIAKQKKLYYELLEG